MRNGLLSFKKNKDDVKALNNVTGRNRKKKEECGGGGMTKKTLPKNEPRSFVGTRGKFGDLSEIFFAEFAKSTKVKKSFVKLGGLCERSYPDSAVAETCRYRISSD